jgi:hypothetical protein
MIAVGQTPLLIYAIGRQHTYRQRKKAEKKPCMENADALSCAIRHTRCLRCPYNNFFRPDRPSFPSKVKDK